MRVSVSSIAVFAAICCLCVSGHASTLIDVWRTPYGVPRSLSLDSDGSCWAVIGSSVMHFAADGTVLSQSNGFWYPHSVSVNPADGSCWVADRHNKQLVRLDPRGKELLRLDGFEMLWSVSVYPTDGSCWTAGRDIARVAANGTVMHRQSAYAGRWVAVNPADGSCWVTHYRHPSTGDQIHLCLSRFDPDGPRQWTNFDVGGGAINALMPLSVNESDDTCWMANPDDDDDIVLHIDADGIEIARHSFPELGHPLSVAVDPEDGSCWLGFSYAPGYYSTVLHMSENGSDLGDGLTTWDQVLALALDPTDGSCWAGLGDLWGRTPPGVALRDSTGDVVHFTADGEELWRHGNLGSPLWRLAVVPEDGSCWVIAGDRLLHLDRHGQEVGTIGGLEGLSEFALNPTDGSFWVVDGPGSTIFHIAADGSVLSSSSDFENRSIMDIAVNPSDGSCRAVDCDPLDHLTGGRVTCLAENGAILWRVGGFNDPHAVSVDPGDGSCWVASATGVEDRITHLAADGTELWRTTEINDPQDVAVYPGDGSCWVAHLGHHRVLQFAKDGTLRSSSPGFEYPRWLAVDPTDGSCWVSEQIGEENQNKGNIVHLATTGEEILRAGGVGGYSPIAVGAAKDAIWVIDGGSGQLARFRIWFDDVPRGHWAFEAVLACVEAGIVGGYDDGTYRPTVPVDRATMAVYIARARAGGEDNVPAGPAEATFEDVPTDHWAYDQVEYCYAQNVVQGYTETTYQPMIQVTRDQMAVYIARAMVAPTGEAALADYAPADPRNFPDVPETYWAWKHIEYCVENGVVKGYNDGCYHPEVVVSRDQMAVYVARAFGLVS